MALPRYMVLKSTENDKFLNYIPDEGNVHRFIRADGEEIISPYAKIAVEVSETASDLVHLRCGYNNRYFAAKSSDSHWIVASADTKEEDITKSTCTLFQILSFNEQAKTVVFTHRNLKRYLRVMTSAASPFTNCLMAADQSTASTFSYFDWETLVILPRYVAFKGFNGKYLNYQSDSLDLKFNAADKEVPTAANEIVTYKDGSIGIKSYQKGMYWADIDATIMPEFDDEEYQSPVTSILAHFWPVKLDRNVIVLRNINNFFCSVKDENSSLAYIHNSITKEARLEVEELVIAREVYNVVFRLSEARIYNQSVLVVTTADGVNTSHEPVTDNLSITYTNTKGSTWNSSVSLALGVTATISTGIPFIGDFGIEISAQFEGAYEWGEAKEDSVEVKNEVAATVPPMTRVKLSVIATRGSCDVPFSYTQRDTLFNGQQVTRTMHDGIYTGINSFNFRYETSEESVRVLPIDENGNNGRLPDCPPPPPTRDHHHHHNHPKRGE